jgi:hypothetical protein
VHPKFLDVVRIFCEKVGPVEESFNAFFMNIVPFMSLDKTRVPRNWALVESDSNQADECSYGTSLLDATASSVGLTVGFVEIGYNVKYVARHGRTYPNDPFSIREVGVYQKYSSKDRTCQWIFLQAPDALKDRIRATMECSGDERRPASQVQIHALLLCSVSEEWRDYLVYLEENFNKVVSFSSCSSQHLLTDLGRSWLLHERQRTTNPRRHTGRFFRYSSAADIDRQASQGFSNNRPQSRTWRANENINEKNSINLTR